MQHYNKKGAISLPLATVIVLIIFLAIVAVNLLLGVLVKEKYDDTEFLNCKLAIDYSQGIKVEKQLAGLTGSLQPIAVECDPIVINNSYFEEADDESAVARIILDKMRIAWWATGRGNYKNVWNDILAGDSVCKSLYYFRLEEILPEEGISRSRFLVHLENDKLPKIDASLADYIQASSGFGNKYFIATDDEGIVNDKVYGIFISSATNGFNSLILAEVVQNSADETQTSINTKVKELTNGDRETICTEMIGFGNKLQRFWIV